MTRLLVSVRDEEEAHLALAAGVDLIDVKEPSSGSLGAASPHLWRAVTRMCDGACPVSAALGELLSDHVNELAACTQGLSFAKVGLAGCGDVDDWVERWRKCLARLPEGVAAVAVAYADATIARAPSPEAVLENATSLGCRAFLFDTFRKDGSTLLDHITQERLNRLVTRGQSLGMTVVLGGSLTAAHVPLIFETQADYLAVRGAVCRQSRESRLDQSLVLCLLDTIRKHAAMAAHDLASRPALR